MHFIGGKLDLKKYKVITYVNNMCILFDRVNI